MVYTKTVLPDGADLTPLGVYTKTEITPRLLQDYTKTTPRFTVEIPCDTVVEVAVYVMSMS